MSTSTLAVLVLVAVLVMSTGASASSGPPTVTKPAEPQTQINPGGDTFSQVMAAITAVSGAVKSGIDAASERG